MFLAQTAAPTGFLVSWLAVAASVAAVLGLIAFFVVVLFRHLQSVRQLTHLERMRMLEDGFPIEAPAETKAHAKFMHNAFWISFWLVFSVPAAALSAASGATSAVNGSTTLLAVIWSAAGAASIAAVGCATWLMIHTKPGKEEEATSWSNAKKVA